MDTRAELQRGLSMVKLLAAAYEYREEAPPADLLAWLAPAGAECAIFSDPEHPGGAIAAIRGTKGWSDWLRDFDLHKTPAFDGLPGKVHRGMDCHARHLLQELREALRGYSRITIAAHSLGAGTGPIVTRDLVKHGIPVREVWLFGMPRMADQRYAEAWNKWIVGAEIDARRVVAIGVGNRQDPVTRIPLSRPPGNWWHVAPPLIITAEGYVYRTPTAWERVRAEHPFGERSRLVSWALQWAALTRLRWAVGAHGTGHYAAALGRALARLEGER